MKQFIYLISSSVSETTNTRPRYATNTVIVVYCYLGALSLHDFYGVKGMCTGCELQVLLPLSLLHGGEHKYLEDQSFG